MRTRFPSLHSLANAAKTLTSTSQFSPSFHQMTPKLPTTKPAIFAATLPRNNYNTWNNQAFRPFSSSAPDQAKRIEEMIASLPVNEKNCMKIFSDGAKSFGSTSKAAHTAIAEGFNRAAMAINNVNSMAELIKLGIKGGPFSNSGEGGEFPERNGTVTQSLARQVASARFGVTIEYVANAVILQIKINQGAKPGVGGELPASKVTPDIARARLTTPWVGLVSPPPHHDLYSIEDLKLLIHDLRSANPHATISVKLAATDDIGVVAAGVAKCGADNISIAGPGGTGAASLTAKYEFVHPWEKALAEVHQTLIENGLRSSVTLTASGGFQTGLDVFKAILLGADYVELGTPILVSLGCVMAEVCHDGTCPTGIATQDETNIKENFKGKPEDVVRFLIALAKSTNYYLEKYGFSSAAQAVGRTDLLAVKDNAPITGLEKLLVRPANRYAAFGKLIHTQGSSYTEQTVITRLLNGETRIKIPASTKDLSFGARIGYYSLQEEYRNVVSSATIEFEGLAVGQSFGAFLPPGITLVAKNSNDYTGKALSGGSIFIEGTAGNQTAMGGTSGEIMARFMGDRTGVCNRGVRITAEMIGEMGANFMTGGWLNILGSPWFYPKLSFNSAYKVPVLHRTSAVGYNLGAGMSGGGMSVPKELYQTLLTSNYLSSTLRKVQPLALDDQDAEALKNDLQNYIVYIPQSWVGTILSATDWPTLFVKLDPRFVLTNNITIPVASMMPSFSQPSYEVLTSTASIKTPAPLVTSAKTALKPAALANPAITHPDPGKDACGTGILVSLDKIPSHELVKKVLIMLDRFKQRGSRGIDPETRDGGGIAWYGADRFFQNQFPQLDLQAGCYSVIPMNLNNEESLENRRAKKLLADLLAKENLHIAASRIVPTKRELLGFIGQEQEVMLEQFVVKKPENCSQEEFEKKLVLTRLRFELTVQLEKFKVRPTIYSASSYHVIYKSLVKEELFAEYFPDLAHVDFEAHAGVAHGRFATNTLPKVLNIQSLPKIANNGENNALHILVRLLTSDPFFKNIVGLDEINLSGLSDSHIMSIYMDMLHLCGYSLEEIVASTIHPYHPTDSAASHFYNLFGIPFEGPNATIAMLGNKFLVVRDKNGFRPLRGIQHGDLVYCGSELGAVDMPNGQVIDLPPGQPLLIDLATRQIRPYASSSPLYRARLNNLQACQSNTKSTIAFSADELKLRRLRAGWNEETDRAIMQPLYENGKGSLQSMADQGPIEALVVGSRVVLGNYLKGRFSQVTNPPLAKKEEEPYMSTLTFVGCKPALDQLEQESIEGFVLTSPVVDNHEIADLQARTNSAVIDIIYPVQTHKEGLKQALDAICEQAVALVAAGKNLLILSDLAANQKHAAIPPVLAASCVDQALLQAGLRRRASIALQAGELLAGRDAAQAISIGGADIINPYLAFYGESEQRCNNYKETLRQEILGFMARMGISSVSAYRGLKGFTTLGLSEELINLLGIINTKYTLGGFTLEDLANAIKTNHQWPQSKGVGKYRGEPSEPRKKIWGLAPMAIKIARGQTTDADMKEYEAKANLLRKGMPRGWLRLKEPQIWSAKNPMTICILGFGAAASFQIQSLLESGLPIKIVVLEKQFVNRFGLVGDGIAPDHAGTKKQARIFQSYLEHPQVEYYGGVEVGETVSYDALKKIYPCIIDCRGAAEDVKLNIPGESLPGIMPASKVYTTYNGAFSPFKTNDWPFNDNSKNPEIGIIGNGNVSADIARIFLQDPDNLEETNINKAFLAKLREQSVQVVHLFARGNPADSKIGLKELRELKELGITIAATYDASVIDTTKLSPEQTELFNFFASLSKDAPAIADKKILHFHFQMIPKAFAQSDKEVEATFLDKKGQEHPFRLKGVITAIGKRPITSDEIIYASGWVTGKGGTLVSAEQSALQTTEKVKEDFAKGIFHHRMGPPTSQPWQINAVSKQEYLNILHWLEDGKELQTLADFFQAKHYTGVTVAASKPTVEQVAQPNTSTANVAKVDKTTIAFKDESGTTHYLPVTQSSTGNLLTFLKENVGAAKAPKHECGGVGKCSTCEVVVEKQPSEKPLTEVRAEKEFKRAGLISKHGLLSCLHETKEAQGAILRVPQAQVRR